MPIYVSLDVAMTVCVAPGYVRANVRQALIQTFSGGELPGGGHGFFHPDHFTFGQPVYLSRALIAAAIRVPSRLVGRRGRRPAQAEQLGVSGRPEPGKLAAGYIAMGWLEMARAG